MTVIDPAGLTGIVRHRLLTLFGQVLTEILSKNKQTNHGSRNGYCAENHESHCQARLGTFKRKIGQHLTVALKENRKTQNVCFRTVKTLQINPLYR